MAASDMKGRKVLLAARMARDREGSIQDPIVSERNLSLIHISEPTRPY